MTTHSIKKVAIIPYDQYISFIKAKNRHPESASDDTILKRSFQTGSGPSIPTLKQIKPEEDSGLNTVNKDDLKSKISKVELISPEVRDSVAHSPSIQEGENSTETFESDNPRSPPPPGIPSLKRKISFLNHWID